MRFIRWFAEVGLADVGLVGGKVASLGEMIRELQPLGIRVPDGFAVTAEGYRHFIAAAGLAEKIRQQLDGIAKGDVQALVARSAEIRKLMVEAALPREIADEAVAAYRSLSARSGRDDTDVAVRSSATAEDLPDASFAGQQETLPQRARRARRCSRRCSALLRLALHRSRHQLSRRQRASTISTSPCRWACSRWCARDQAASGVIFTLDPESGFRDAVLVTGAYGLGEFVVQGQVDPDEFTCSSRRCGHGPSARSCGKTLGAKELSLVYAAAGTRAASTVPDADGRRARASA